MVVSFQAASIQSPLKRFTLLWCDIGSSYYRYMMESVVQGNLHGIIEFVVLHEGFEVALKTMRVGGRRRIIIPPELGPPTGPSTFFSAKQCEVSCFCLSSEYAMCLLTI